MDDPKCTYPMTEMLLSPKLNLPKTDSAEPTRANVRTDNDEPKRKKSQIDKEDPRRENDLTDIEEPQ
jgi:hypothetical protein